MTSIGIELLVAAPLDLDLDRRPLRAAQLLHRLLGRSSPWRLSPAICAMTSPRRMPFLYAGDPSNTRVAVMSPSIGSNLNADAVVAPFLPLAHLRVLARVEEARMRIERAEHAANGAVDEVVGLDLVDVVRLDRAQRRGERLVVLGNLVVDRERAPAEQSADQSARRRSQRRRQGEGGNVA